MLRYQHLHRDSAASATLFFTRTGSTKIQEPQFAALSESESDLCLRLRRSCELWFPNLSSLFVFILCWSTHLRTAPYLFFNNTLLYVMLPQTTPSLQGIVLRDT